MRQAAVDVLRRRAGWVVRVNVLLLLPGFFAGLIGFTATLNPNPLTLWCEEWGGLLLFAGMVGFVIAQLATPWVFQCLSCRFRFSRAGITALHFLLRPSPIRFCPHCGVDLTKTGSGSLPLK
jgi:hypothetical protein